MVDKDDVQRLAALARLSVTEDQKETLAKEMSDIVDFVSQIQEISENTESVLTHKNIMREDGTPHEGGAYTEALLSNAQTTKGKYIVVPKIISND